MQELNSLFVTRHGVLIRELSFYLKPPIKTLDITTNNSGEYHYLGKQMLTAIKTVSCKEKYSELCFKRWCSM